MSKEKGEQTHRRARKFNIYTERLKLLFPTLSYRGIRSDVVEVYKILDGIYDKNARTLLKLWKDMAPDGVLEESRENVILREPKDPLEMISLI